jgi:UDP-N-acetylmuramate-alanine ligase
VLSPQDILDKSDLAGSSKFQVSGYDQDLVDSIKAHLSSGDLVIVMGAGDIDGWARENLL